MGTCCLLRHLFAAFFMSFGSIHSLMHLENGAHTLHQNVIHVIHPCYSIEQPAKLKKPAARSSWPHPNKICHWPTDTQKPCPSQQFHIGARRPATPRICWRTFGASWRNLSLGLPRGRPWPGRWIAGMRRGHQGCTLGRHIL